ncbi:hypothetical protein [Mangrovibacterium diazotrophicum]|uniref:Uncharacterized protein n=1 Tax=Mangrovibacterium diazotrophicum TaxID=1261403 RepID=A0A419VVJ0_9BACT|nr:hypothetical protein [Mangrovibacterium diazotrophicum]RKD86179.1 hypothetical protein BC643_4496 [Mangrovibacterium diazotrophicum]
MKRELTTLMMVFQGMVVAFAQTPEHYPPPVPEPVAPTLFNIILYLVIPIALVIFLIYYRRKRRDRKK